MNGQHDNDFVFASAEAFRAALVQSAMIVTRGGTDDEERAGALLGLIDRGALVDGRGSPIRSVVVIPCDGRDLHHAPGKCSDCDAQRERDKVMRACGHAVMRDPWEGGKD